MKKILLPVLVLTGILGTLSASAADYPVLNLPESSSPVSTALWQTTSHILEPKSAKAEVKYTQDSLIITCSGKVEKVISGKGEGPNGIFGGCTAEIFLQPDPAKPVYYQFAVSPDNRLYQAMGWDYQWKFPVPVKTKTEIKEGFWSAEFEIPFAALGCTTPKPGECWKANFIFGSTWSPASDYHDPSQFGTLIFGSKEPCGVEVDEFTFKDGNLSLSLTNHGTTSAKLQRFNDCKEGTEVEFLPGVTMSVLEKTELADTHKNIHKFGVRITQDGKTYSFSGLAPVAEPDRGGLKKFYYAPGELPEHPEPGEYRYGTATASVKPAEFFKSVPQTGANLTLKENHFELDGVPYYPVADSRLRVYNCMNSFGSAKDGEFQANPVIAEKCFERAKKDNAPSLFRILYESQLASFSGKNAKGETVQADQIAVLEAAYKKLKKEHPDAVITIQADGAELRKERIARCCDVFEYGSWSSSYAPAQMAYLEDDLDSLIADANGKPYMFWLGGFKSGGVNRSAEELRASVFLCIIKGCAGNVLHLEHGGLPKSDTHAQDLLQHLQSEINSFYAAFANGSDVTAEYRISGDPAGEQAGPVRFAIRKQKDGSSLLVAVNTSSAGTKMYLFHGKSLLKEMDFTPYGVLVLELK